MTLDEKVRWNKKYGEDPHALRGPDPFLVSAYGGFLAARPPGNALDVAGGTGRHALWLADRGWRVRLIDVSEVGVEAARRNFDKVSLQPHSPAGTMRGSVSTEVLDLNSQSDLGCEVYDLILVFYYLQRELFPALLSALKTNGLLIYKTYNTERANRSGGPSNPAFLLEPNELLRAFQSLRILHYHETLQGDAVTELVARK
jgi:SAM-dependent methyltransferase